MCELINANGTSSGLEDSVRVMTSRGRYSAFTRTDEESASDSDCIVRSASEDASDDELRRRRDVLRQSQMLVICMILQHQRLRVSFMFRSDSCDAHASPPGCGGGRGTAESQIAHPHTRLQGEGHHETNARAAARRTRLLGRRKKLQQANERQLARELDELVPEELKELLAVKMKAALPHAPTQWCASQCSRCFGS